MLTKKLSGILSEGFIKTYHEADGAGGSGNGNESTDTTATATQTDTNTQTDTQQRADTTADKGQNSNNDDASKRWAITREREKRQEIERKYAELEKKLSNPAPKFDENSDPDGTKEIDHRIQTSAEKMLADMMDKLGIKDTLSQIKYEKEQEQFFQVVESRMPELSKLGIETPSREDMLGAMRQLDEHGITPDQLIILSQLEKVMNRLKPGGFAPDTGGKAEPTKELSQKEINDNIFRKHGLL